MFGSMATKLAIDSSDMDVAICGVVDVQKLAAEQSLDAKEVIVA